MLFRCRCPYFELPILLISYVAMYNILGSLQQMQPSILYLQCFSNYNINVAPKYARLELSHTRTRSVCVCVFERERYLRTHCFVFHTCNQAISRRSRLQFTVTRCSCIRNRLQYTGIKTKWQSKVKKKLYGKVKGKNRYNK